MKIPDPVGRLFDVGGFQLHLHEAGHGEPAVVFEAGGASWSLDWTLVQNEVAKFTHTCSYDRAGFGWSQSGPEPRTVEQMVKELHTLLTQAEVKKPCIFVGASFGGHVVRLYAHYYPEEVAGIVLLDARHEDIDDLMPPAWRQQIKMGARMYQTMVIASKLHLLPVLGKIMGKKAAPPIFNKLPQELQKVYMEAGFQTKYWEVNLAELKASAESDRQLRVAKSLNNIPLTVIRHGMPSMFNRMPKKQAAQAEQVWQELQKRLAGLSTNSSLMIAGNSGHGIQIDEPGLVVEAIRQMVKKEGLN